MLARTATTPQELASRLGCDIDDVLLMLWDAGIDYPNGPFSKIRSEDRATAERVCGLASSKEKTSVAYWRETLRYSDEEFIEYAASIGIRITSQSRRLPKNALSKLQKAYSKTAMTRAKPPVAIVAAEPRKPFVWEERGHVRKQLLHLTEDDAEKIHWAIAYDFADTADPIIPAGVRDRGLLQSALSRPQTGSNGQFKYPTVEMAAAALMHSIVHNHPFYNGNKRTALVSMLSFLDANRFVLVTNEAELFRWTVRVASHGLNKSNLSGDLADIEVSEMTEWISQHTRSIDSSQRIVTAVALTRRLEELGCDVSRIGMKINVTRQLDHGARASLFGKQRILKHTLPYMGDGRQVAKSHVQNLRKALRLSEEHGIDSATFFGADQTPIDEFISRYRKTLSRLAKV